MLIAMLVLFPLLLKFKKTFIYVISPLIFIFIYGYAWQNFSSGFSPPSAYLDFISKGLLRAFSEICLGVIAFGVAQYLQKYKFTKLTLGILTFVELLAFAGILITLDKKGEFSEIALISLLLFIVITITFSKQNLILTLFDKKVFFWLGAFSFDLYISHGFWSHAMIVLFPNNSYLVNLSIYLIIVVITALFVKTVSNLIRKTLSKVNKERFIIKN